MTSRPPRPPRAGNALIEFMVILVVAGVLAAVILPRYGRPAQGADTEEARERLTGLLESARALALEQDPDGDGLGNWPQGPQAGFPLDRDTARFTYRICQGAGANGDTPFAIRAAGKPGTDVEGHVITLWIGDLHRPRIESGDIGGDESRP